MTAKALRKLISAACSVTLIFFNSSIFAQTAYLPGTTGTKSSQDIIPPDKVITVPEESKTRFKPGEAPFYIQLQFFSDYLSSAFSGDLRPIIEGLSKELEIDVNDLEFIAHQLATSRGETSRSSQNMLLNECILFLQDRSISNTQAREIIERIDNSDQIGYAVTQNILNNIKNQLGDKPSLALNAQIREFGNSLTYTKVEMAKFIEIKLESDYAGYLKTQCESL